MPKTASFEQTKDNTVVLVVEEPVRLLSHVARADLAKIVQRLLTKNRRFTIREVWMKYRHRIPGTLRQYGVTISYLMNSRQLKNKRFHR